MEDVYLIVGLGNPGGEYARTRHNAGFMLAELAARRWKARWAMEKKFQSRLARCDNGGRKVLLCCPQTFMNASGEAVAAVQSYYRVPVERIMVVVDDADLPLGGIRLRPGGSPGGHHGLESVEQHLGTRDYARLRIGIGREPQAGRQITGFVLGEFQSSEWEQMEKVLDRAFQQVECWLEQGLAQAMNRFNGAIIAPIAKKEIE